LLRLRDEQSGSVQDFVVERLRYGETLLDASTNNLRGQLWQHYDGSGLAQVDALDWSGKPLVVRRRLGSEVEGPAVDWSGRDVQDIHTLSAAGLEDEVFTQRTEYDALGRMTRHYNWHVESPSNSGLAERVAVYLPLYNQRGLLKQE